VEAITGNVWFKSSKFQHNIGILESYISLKQLNTNATEVPLPVFWLDELLVFNDNGSQDHHQRVSILILEPDCII
jgi:hypothetical protein